MDASGNVCLQAQPVGVRIDPVHVNKTVIFGIRPEDLVVDSDGVVYAGEVGPIQGMTKFIPRLIP